VANHYFGVEILAGYSSTLSVIGVVCRVDGIAMGPARRPSCEIWSTKCTLVTVK